MSIWSSFGLNLISMIRVNFGDGDEYLTNEMFIVDFSHPLIADKYNTSNLNPYHKFDIQ